MTRLAAEHAGDLVARGGLTRAATVVRVCARPPPLLDPQVLVGVGRDRRPGASRRGPAAPARRPGGASGPRRRPRGRRCPTSTSSKTSTGTVVRRRQDDLERQHRRARARRPRRPGPAAGPPRPGWPRTGTRPGRRPAARAATPRARRRGRPAPAALPRAGAPGSGASRGPSAAELGLDEGSSRPTACSRRSARSEARVTSSRPQRARRAPPARALVLRRRARASPGRPRAEPGGVRIASDGLAVLPLEPHRSRRAAVDRLEPRRDRTPRRRGSARRPRAVSSRWTRAASSAWSVGWRPGRSGARSRSARRRAASRARGRRRVVVEQPGRRRSAPPRAARRAWSRRRSLAELVLLARPGAARRRSRRAGSGRGPARCARLVARPTRGAPSARRAPPRHSPYQRAEALAEARRPREAVEQVELARRLRAGAGARAGRGAPPGARRAARAAPTVVGASFTKTRCRPLRTSSRLTTSSPSLGAMPGLVEQRGHRAVRASSNTASTWRSRRRCGSHVGLGARAEEEQQGVDEDRLAGARLAGEHVQARRRTAPSAPPSPRDCGSEARAASRGHATANAARRSTVSYRSPHLSFVRSTEKKIFCGPRRSRIRAVARRTSTTSPALTGGAHLAVQGQHDVLVASSRVTRCAGRPAARSAGWSGCASRSGSAPPRPWSGTRWGRPPRGSRRWSRSGSR